MEGLGTVLRDEPRVADALDAAFRRSDRTSYLERSALRVGQLLKSDLDWPQPSAAPEPFDAAVIAFVEQWVIDVASMTDELVAGVRDELGDDRLMDFVHSLLVVEQRMRLELAWCRLGLLSSVDNSGAIQQMEAWRADAVTARREGLNQVSACAGRIALGRHGDPELTAALSEWQAAVVCLDDVDPITTELVRLRCANYHDCHT